MVVIRRIAVTVGGIVFSSGGDDPLLLNVVDTRTVSSGDLFVRLSWTS